MVANPIRRQLAGCASPLALALVGALAAPAALAQDSDAAPDAPVVLDTVTLSGDAATEGTGRYTTQAASGTAAGLDLSARETPQSVSVMTSQQMQDQGITTLNQVVDWTPGLTAQQGNGEFRWIFYARGSAVENQQFDGVPNYVHYYSRDVNPQEDMAMFDRVEVVRGATGLLEGTGSPSASINLVRKMPTAERQSSVEVEASSFGNGRLTYDTSGPITADGRLRGRFVASALAGNGFRDYMTDERGLLYGVLEYDLTDSTTISAALSHGKEKIDGYSWGGVWTARDGSFYDFDSHTASAAEWEYSDREQTVGYLDLRHEFDNGWELTAKLRRSNGMVDMLSSYMWYDTTGALYRDGALFHYVSQTNSGDLRLSGKVTLFGREHDLVFGVNGNRDRTRYDGKNPYTYVIADPSVADPNEHPYPEPSDVTYFGDMVSRNYGLYGSARWSLAENVKLITGARVSWYEAQNESGYAGSNSSDGYKVDAEVTPYVGLVYDVNDTWTVYGSYTGIFTPQNALGVDGLIDPVYGKNFEVGAKAALLDGGLTFAAAAFQTDQDGLAEDDPDNTGCGGPATGCSINAGLIRTRGAEFELSGAVSDRWNVAASYTYAHAEYEEGEDAGQRYNTGTAPLHLVKLNTTYRLAGALEGLTVGGALRYQSRTYQDNPDGSFDSGGAPYAMRQGGFAVADVMARYELSEATAVQLNVNNLFDKQYYSAIASPGYGNFIGRGRNATLSLVHRF
ncbi:TonB-dependent siderophore receptor [Paracoccus aminovorans]|uniref:TonB-dependent siderophore receptor n=1 Tax=Paracoccus aminovorans TaxID=34004 RepID=UPI000785C9EB|nr:TonB-dependent siderophore receptor [Paracoccus aminovorans]MDQ7774383.1 TonB-dependent siderophore receptor [Paracoccus aminovorans]